MSCNARSTGILRLAHGLTLALIGCAAGPTTSEVRAPTRPAPEHAEHIVVPARVVTPDAVADVEELFVRGQTHLRQGRPAEAAALFDSIVKHDASGPLAERALFQSALAHEGAGDLRAAAQRFEQLEQRHPETPPGAEASVRALRVLLHLEDWPRAAALGARYLARPGSPAPLGAILAYAARALDEAASGDAARAEYFVSKGLLVVERHGLDRAGRIPRDVAVLYFALGEARRQRAEAATLSADVREFSARLEQRCQRLLDAQSAYSDSMRAYDAHWSAIAGYRVAELYEGLHRELMQIPMPRAGDERQEQLFEAAMRLRYSVLLGKASSMLEHTLAMATRSGERSEWVLRAERAHAALAAAVEEEREALARLPFSRAELERALDDVAARAAQPAGAGAGAGKLESDRIR